MMYDFVAPIKLPLNPSVVKYLQENQVKGIELIIFICSEVTKGKKQQNRT